jgi:pyrroloquinoline quinone biosynthesis protein B
MKKRLLFLIFLASTGYNNVIFAQTEAGFLQVNSETTLVILGTIQDAGSPHIACKKECCATLFENPDSLRKVVSLGIIDSGNDKTYLFEATPDIAIQIKKLKQFANSESELPDGIFVTHAHIGHYTGLMYLGKEATNSHLVPVYAMPLMKVFLEENGPWSQLVANRNISLQEIEDQKEIRLTSNLKVIPFTVPHRDEFSETVGFKIAGPKKSVLFIPDIDKWEKWETSITEAISEVDYAFIDATFHDGEEINNRDISEIPHPFIIESMELFKGLPLSEKQKIYFIHFNHSNPVIDSESGAYKGVIENGFNIAQINTILKL